MSQTRILCPNCKQPQAFCQCGVSIQVVVKTTTSGGTGKVMKKCPVCGMPWEEFADRSGCDEVEAEIVRVYNYPL